MQRMRPSVPGAGTQAAAMVKISNAIRQIQEAASTLPIGSELFKAANKAVADLSKHFPQVEGGEGAQATAAQDQIRQLQRQAMLRRIMQNSGGPQAPPPATPLPGA